MNIYPLNSTQAKAEQEEAKIAFRQTLLEAGQEVNDLLARRCVAFTAGVVTSSYLLVLLLG